MQLTPTKSSYVSLLLLFEGAPKFIVPNTQTIDQCTDRIVSSQLTVSQLLPYKAANLYRPRLSQNDSFGATWM